MHIERCNLNVSNLNVTTKETYTWGSHQKTSAIFSYFSMQLPSLFSLLSEKFSSSQFKQPHALTFASDSGQSNFHHNNNSLWWSGTNWNWKVNTPNQDLAKKKIGIGSLEPFFNHPEFIWGRMAAAETCTEASSRQSFRYYFILTLLLVCCNFDCEKNCRCV